MSIGLDIPLSGDLSRRTLKKTAGKHAPAFGYVIAWMVLLLLTGLSLPSAYLHLGVFAPVVEFGIAATEAAIAFILFMRLKAPPSLKWLFACAGFFWLLFLCGAQHHRLRDPPRLAIAVLLEGAAAGRR